MKKLYIVYLGGEKEEGRFGEDHEVVVVAADGERDAKSQARSKWQGAGEAHVDSVMEIQVVDGFDVTLSKSKTSERDVLNECTNDFS